MAWRELWPGKNRKRTITQQSWKVRACVSPRHHSMKEPRASSPGFSLPRGQASLSTRPLSTPTGTRTARLCPPLSPPPPGPTRPVNAHFSARGIWSSFLARSPPYLTGLCAQAAATVGFLTRFQQIWVLPRSTEWVLGIETRAAVCAGSLKRE